MKLVLKNEDKVVRFTHGLQILLIRWMRSCPDSLEVEIDVKVDAKIGKYLADPNAAFVYELQVLKEMVDP